ncbi:MAG: 3-hydroxyacyl-CoA dehydrogenase family protein, partial [Nocardioidaceae bacterium]
MTSTGRDFRSIGVIGLGTMGAGIAEVFARNGYPVVGVELNDETMARGRAHVQHSTDRAVKRGKLSEDEQDALLGRITFTTSVEEVKDCDLVVEAIVEQLPLKQQLFRALDGIVRPETILAT